MPRPPPPGPPPLRSPPGPRPNVPPAPEPPRSVLGFSAFLPKPKLLLTRKLNENLPELVKEFTGTRVSPGCGTKSKDPNRFVTTFVGMDLLEANAGRSLNMESPFRSCPVVTVNGIPELASRNGLRRNE